MDPAAGIPEQTHESFPLLVSPDEKRSVAALAMPRAVPLSWLRSYEKNVLANHGQPLAALASRGGLHPSEVWAAVHRRPVGPPLAEAVRWLIRRPWFPVRLEDECVACGGTFRAEAVGDYPEAALKDARVAWRNAHSGRCGHGELLVAPFTADSWPYTRLSVVYVIGWSAT